MAYSKSVVQPIVAGILLSSVAQSGMVTAQVLEEVIVTSQLRAESLQDVPVSVTAVSGAKMQEAGIDKIEDLQSYVPNLTMSETGIGTNIYIRGIGSGINQGFEQSTGMYVDGVSYGRGQLSRAPFLDLERVEVLRGPQNIFFGKNSIAGALSVVTAKPGDEFEGSVSALYEPDHGEKVYDLVLSGPITDNLGGRLAYRNRTMDGYIENLTDGDDEPNRDEQTVRLILDWQASEDLDIAFKYEAGFFDVAGRQVEIDNEEPSINPAYVGPDGNLNYSQILRSGLGGAFAQQHISVEDNSRDGQRSSNGDYSDNTTDNYTLTANYALNEGTLTVIGAFMEYDYEELCDCDFTGANVFSFISEEEYEQTSFELRFASDVGNTFEYVTGLYYQDSKLDFSDQFLLAADSVLVGALDARSLAEFVAAGGAAVDAPKPGTDIEGTSAPRAFQQDSELWSAFVQFTYIISDDLRLTLGGRYSDEEKEASRSLDVAKYDGSQLVGQEKIDAVTVYTGVFLLEPHNLSDSISEDSFAPSITTEYDFNDEVMVYATASKGFKSGGFDVRSNASPNTAFPVGKFIYDKEEATNFEIGAKTTLLDGAAELNVALFITQYDDLQVSIYDSKVGFNVGNAAEAETQGVEIDGRWMLSDSLSLTAAIAFLDFEFKNFKNGQCTQGVQADIQITFPAGFPPSSEYDGYCDYTGETNQYVADWSGNLGLDYTNSIGNSLLLRANLDVIFTDDYNPSQTLDPASEQDGYTKINARIALADINDAWEVALVGKNLTDEDIVTYSNATPLAFSTFQAASRYNFYERERSVALQGVYRF